VPKANGTSRLFAIAGGLRRTRLSRGDTIVYSVPVGTVTEYLPGTNRWVRRADAPYVWQVVPQAAVLDGRIYMPGGLVGTGENFYASRTMAVYTVATDSWTTVAMPQYMTAHTVWASNGRLYPRVQGDGALSHARGSRQLGGGQVRLLGRVGEKVDPPHGMNDRRRPRARLAPLQRRWAATRQPFGHAPAERRVLGVEVPGGDGVREGDDRVHARPQMRRYLAPVMRGHGTSYRNEA
jgi:hypothetical protein